MSKVSLLRNVMKLNRPTGTGEANQSFRSLLIHSPKGFSTEAQPPDQTAFHIDQILQNAGSGAFYGYLYGASKYALKNALKTDILRLLDGCNLGPDDLKFKYTKEFLPQGIIIQFRNRSAYDHAIKTLSRIQGSIYRLDRGERSGPFGWDQLNPHDGKSLLLQGISRNALLEDIERFLSGCDYDATSIRVFVTPVNQVPVRMAIVRFPSPTLAMSAYLTKNKGFCLNSQILVRVLQ